MKILVVGGGGREHALAWKLSQEAEVFCAPGNPGIAGDCPCYPDVTSEAEVVALAQSLAVDLVVVGPEDPLIAGLADTLRSQGIAVFGPGADGARLEASKAFSKDLMAQAGIPTALGRSFTSLDLATEWIRERFAAGRGVAVKASGAALGKGVVVAATEPEAIEAAAHMLGGGLGEAGTTVVVEDRLEGFEFSLLTLVSGTDLASLPIAQDYKRIRDGDEGPNTGGMGTYSPVPRVSEQLAQRAEDELVRPMVEHLASQGIDYRGVLFTGVMVEGETPYCLEYNVRFGDPETQSVMRRLGPGLAQTLLDAAHGRAPTLPAVLPNAVATVVLASEGYPGTVIKGRQIAVGAMPVGVKVFHAGTALAMGQLVTAGGRVFGVSAEASTLAEARALAYQGADQIQFLGKQFRTDIAAIS